MDKSVPFKLASARENVKYSLSTVGTVPITFLHQST